MEKFVGCKGLVVPLDRSNIDTDAIIPKQFLKSIKRSGFGQYLFDEWRYLDHGEPGKDVTQRILNPDFILNHTRFSGAKILLTRANFGCGSSREHAPWALQDYGFQVILASSYADIFFNNAFKIGLLPIVLKEDIVDQLFHEVNLNVGYSLDINLEEQKISTPDGMVHIFDVEPFRKENLLKGLDEIGLTLQHTEKIRSYENRRKIKRPWLFI
tara:strand:+ start:5414 stop:6052 length:639 start_codon:yes stop_codon:yes gene_type:complete